MAKNVEWAFEIPIRTGPGVETVANASPPDPASGQNVTGQATTCDQANCIDLRFSAVGGPTASFHWSASSLATNPNSAWGANFGNGGVDGFSSKTLDDLHVRAVRAGSCSS